MIDFTEYQTVPKTFELESTIAENERYKFDNRFLIGLIIIIVIGGAGLALYFVKEQRQFDERYNSKDV